MCKKCLWLKSHWEKADTGQDINENVSTNEKCLIWQMGQSENFAKWGMLLELPCQTNTRILLGNH